MLLTKKLVGLLVISMPAMVWQANVSADVLGFYRQPIVLLKAERAVAKGGFMLRRVCGDPEAS